MSVEFAEFACLFENTPTSEYAARLLNFLADHPDDPDAIFMLAVLGSIPERARADLHDVLEPVLSAQNRTAASYDRLGNALRTAGLEKLAIFAFKTAAEKDRIDPNPEHVWGNSPFNGQDRRAALFLDILTVAKPEAIIETGTFRGTTTEFFAKHFGGEIYSCELSDRFFQFSASRLSKYPNVHVLKLDSRALLRQLGELSPLKNAPVFFYLDAHWNADLPLREELKIIFENFSNPIIMIDDFEVPAHEEYQFDDYGDDAILSLEILFPAVPKDASLFFPRWNADDDSGAKRGFVLIALDDSAKKIGGLDNYINEISRLDAALVQMKRYRKMYRASVAREMKTRADSSSAAEEGKKEIATLRDALASHALREDEFSSAVASRDTEILALRSNLQTVEANLKSVEADLQKRTKITRQISRIIASLRFQ